MDSIDAVWAALAQHRQEIESTNLNQLFAENAGRFDSFAMRLDDELLVDFSKNLVTHRTLELLRCGAELSGFKSKRASMLRGEKINITEKRAAMHTALRAPRDTMIEVDGRDVAGEIHEVQERVCAFAEAVRTGGAVGFCGKAFTDIVHIGIGGSVLGPAMIIEALVPYHHDSVRVRFVSNVDGAHLHDTLKGLDPGTTLFLIASKTFTTQETMLNATSARRWIVDGLGEDAVSSHFGALSTNLEAANAFGIPADRVFSFWNWVGGRYSLWSAVGLTVAIAIGAAGFRALLAGARRMDDHFASAPLDQNIPATLGLIGIWYRSVLRYSSHAVVPYDQRLSRFSAHLQQVDMESNGKSVRLDGTPVGVPTAGVLWGEAGTNVQHSFFQFLHQGTDVIPCDFLVAATPHENMVGHHDVLIAHCLAQSQALMTGRAVSDTKAMMVAAGAAEDEAAMLAPHRAFPGNRPSTTMVYRRLDPRTLGMLIALYEHKVFTQGVLWGVNSFDQWGGELGKELAGRLLGFIQGKEVEGMDASTRGLIREIRRFRGE